MNDKADAGHMTPRERVRLALEHRETDRVPISMVCSGINAPARVQLEKYLANERGTSVDAYLEPLIDIRNVGPAYVGPALDEGEDVWGVRREGVSYGEGEGEGQYDEIRHYPLKEAADLDAVARHRWPSTDWYDYASIDGEIERAGVGTGGEYCLMIANGNIFESSWYMRGMEQLMMDFVLNPELAHGILRRVTDFWIEHFTEVLRAGHGRIDLVFTADDIAGQEGLLLSPAMWEEFLKPYHVEMNARIHEFGAKVIYHSDGAVTEAVPGLIDMGIDVLQALQFDAKGMDPKHLKDAFGDRLCFEGGVSVQKTLPFGTPEEVRREVTHLVSTLGAGGGYILGPSHAVQAGTPPENIVAMFDTAANAGP